MKKLKKFIVIIVEKYRIYGFKRFFVYSLIELKNKIIMQLLKNSYSQKGEDLIIDKYLGWKKRGFYVDIGAGDGCRFSNTKRFYRKGWGGINIEPDPTSYEKLTKNRKKDINLNLGIGRKNGKFIFYRFTPSTLSTFSIEKAEEYKKQGYKLIDKREIEVRKLDDVLSEYCKDKIIDFMSIDTEGIDIEVLESNNWDKWRPKLIVIETEKNESCKKVYQFLIEKGYSKVFDNNLNSIYLLKE